jgi:hypothetical protein
MMNKEQWIALGIGLVLVVCAWALFIYSISE